jgi:hypothetical protein
MTAKQRIETAKGLDLWSIKRDYSIKVFGINSRETFNRKDELTAHFKAEGIKQLTFFRINQGCKLFGYVIHGVSTVKGKKNGIAILCTLMLGKLVVRLVGNVSDSYDKHYEVISLIKAHFKKEWFYKDPSEDWLRIYDKVPINNAQIRTASIRLKERRYHVLLKSHTKLVEHCKEVSKRQKELSKEIYSNDYMYR